MTSSIQLTDEQQELLTQLEAEFSNRYTEDDPDYARVLQSSPTPPIVHPWYKHSRRQHDWSNQGRQRNRDDRYNRYERHNRDDRQHRDDRYHRDDRQYNRYRPYHRYR